MSVAKADGEGARADVAAEAPHPATPPPANATVASAPVARPARSRLEANGWALLDRPLILPAGLVQLDQHVNVTAFRAPTTYVAAAQLFSVAVGLGSRTELSVLMSSPLENNVRTGAAIAAVSVQLHRNWSLRLDVGYERANVIFSNYDGSTTVQQHNNAVVSLALPARWRFNRVVGLTAFGGSGLHPMWVPNVGGIADAATALFTDALLAFSARDSGPADAKLLAPTFLGAAFVPVGVVVQPHRIVAMHLQTGLRLTFSQFGLTRLFVPIDFDLVVTPHRRVDLGVSLDVPGPLFDFDYGSMVNLGIFARVRI